DLGDDLLDLGELPLDLAGEELDVRRNFEAESGAEEPEHGVFGDGAAAKTLSLGELLQSAAEDRRGRGEQGEGAPEQRGAEDGVDGSARSLAEDEDLELTLGQDTRGEQRTEAAPEDYDVIVASRHD